MTVREWTSYEKASELTESFGGLGGFFRDGMRWADFVDRYTDEGKVYAEALRSSILELKLRHGGDWHQEDDEGAPVFDDGTSATFSYRAWGDLLAAVWSEAENRDYSYMDFYMESTMPEPPEINGEFYVVNDPHQIEGPK